VMSAGRRISDGSARRQAHGARHAAAQTRPRGLRGGVGLGGRVDERGGSPGQIALMGSSSTCNSFTRRRRASFWREGYGFMLVLAAMDGSRSPNTFPFGIPLSCARGFSAIGVEPARIQPLVGLR
jgi:hypothetical protein